MSRVRVTCCPGLASRSEVANQYRLPDACSGQYFSSGRVDTPTPREKRGERRKAGGCIRTWSLSMRVANRPSGSSAKAPADHRLRIVRTCARILESLVSKRRQFGWKETNWHPIQPISVKSGVVNAERVEEISFRPRGTRLRPASRNENDER